MRFPGFEGEWETKKLGEVSKFSKGKGISKSDIQEDGATECIRYGELYTHYGEVINEVKSKTNVDKATLVLSEQNDVIIPASGETQIDIATASCVLRPGVALGGDLNIIKTQNHGVFLAYYLSGKKRQEIANLAQGNSVVHLYSSQLSNLSINLPEIEEQKKIGSLLTLMDGRIQTQNKIIEGLSALKFLTVKKLFSRQLTFKKNDGNSFPKWRKEILSDLLHYEQPTNYIVKSTEYDDNFKVPVLTAGKTFILGYTNEIEGVFDKNELPVIIFDDFTTTTQYVDFQFKVKSSAMKILKAKKGNNVKFIYEAIQMISYKIGGHGRQWISIFSKFAIPYPAMEEQYKIANFLSLIDDKISVEQNLLEKLKQQKQVLLSNLFI